MNFKKNGKLFTSKFVGTGPLSYEKRIYRVAVSQRLRNTALMQLATDPYTFVAFNYVWYSQLTECNTTFLYLFKIRGPHSDDVEDSGVLRFYAVWWIV